MTSVMHFAFGAMTTTRSAFLASAARREIVE
jgi:hypothetical protein